MYDYRYNWNISMGYKWLMACLTKPECQVMYLSDKFVKHWIAECISQNWIFPLCVWCWLPKLKQEDLAEV